jgi:uncharacterized protein YkwD
MDFSEDPMSAARRMAAPTLLAGLLTTAALWLVPAQAATPQATYQRQAFSATNQQRELHDRVQLRRQDCVQRFAVRQATRMARQERMFHQDLGPVLRRCGLSVAGENVAYGYLSGKVVVNLGWMRSEGHRANILHRGFRLMGIGARQSDNGQWYVAQVFGRRA